MLPRRRPNSDRSPELLEAQLRALPRQPVAGELKARLLAAIPSNEISRWERASRRQAVWAGAAVGLAAACLLAVLWPGPGRQTTVPNLVVDFEKKQPAIQVTERPSDSLVLTVWMETRRGQDGADMRTFTWPTQEKLPLMVSTAIPPELFD